MTSDEQEIFYSRLGDQIKKARLKADIKQEAFAGFLKLSRASVVNIEKGRQRPPIHLLWIIAKVLDIDVKELLPHFDASDQSINEWKETIKKKNVGKTTQNKLLDFIEEEMKK